MKKLLAFLLSLCLLGSALAACDKETDTSEATTQPPTESTPTTEAPLVESPATDFRYQVVDGECVFITKYVGNDETVVIPSKIENLPVTVLRGVENTDYPDTVDDGVFEGSHVKTVAFPQTLITIGGRAFLNCKKLTKVIIAPDSALRTVSKKAFANCSSLEEIDLSGTNVNRIDAQAFDGCTALKEIRFCDTVSSIGKRAFYHCTSLQEIALPKELTEIGVEAFGECGSLKRMTIPPKLNLLVPSVDGVVFVCEEEESSLEQIIFEEGREEIAGYAFFALTSNPEIVIPKSVKQFSAEPFFLYESAQFVFLGDCPEILDGMDFYGTPTIFYDPNTSGWQDCIWQNSYTLRPMESFK